MQQARVVFVGCFSLIGILEKKTSPHNKTGHKRDLIEGKELVAEAFSGGFGKRGVFKGQI